jgi:hypothetical protein
MDTFWIPLILAIAGAAIGAYFAIVRTKREKLWTERFEKIGSALSKANLIHRFLDSEINGELEIHGLTKHEKNELNASWPKARYELANDVKMLQMLFTEAEFSSVLRRWESMEKKLFTLIEEGSSHDGHEYVREARPKAEKLEKALIDLSRVKCLGWF